MSSGSDFQNHDEMVQFTTNVRTQSNGQIHTKSYAGPAHLYALEMSCSFHGGAYATAYTNVPDDSNTYVEFRNAEVASS